MDRTDVGPQELGDGMGVEPDPGGFVKGWGSDGRNMGWIHADACGYMQCMRMHGIHGMDGHGRQARASGERRARDGRRVWARVGECRLVS